MDKDLQCNGSKWRYTWSIRVKCIIWPMVRLANYTYSTKIIAHNDRIFLNFIVNGLASPCVINPGQLRHERSLNLV